MSQTQTLFHIFHIFHMFHMFHSCPFHVLSMEKNIKELSSGFSSEDELLEILSQTKDNVTKAKISRCLKVNYDQPVRFA